jgi:hypothetical protein
MTSATLSTSLDTFITLRLPRGILEDLQETVIQQDRQFLTEVGLSMGLSRSEIGAMIRMVLGTGAPQTIPVLWAPPAWDPTATDAATDDTEEEADARPYKHFCPWWERHGEGLWRRCPRHRIGPQLPCPIHERSLPCPLTRVYTDPVIQELPLLYPFTHDGRLFWTRDTPGAPCYNEDGTVPTDGTICFVTFRGQRVPSWRAATEATDS